MAENAEEGDTEQEIRRQQEDGEDMDMECWGSVLDGLPEEVVLHALSFLSARDLGQLAQTSKVL